MTPDTRKSLGSKLREAREYIGLSQEEVAAQLAVTRTAVTQIENGKRKVEALELARLARMYQRPISYFTDENPPAERPRIEQLNRATAELSEKDQDEVLRFAEFLRSRPKSGGK